MSHPRSWWPILAALVALALCSLLLAGATQCYSQTVPTYPVARQPQPQSQLYFVPQPAAFPWIRYRVLGLGPRYDLYVAVGQPFQATVQPVMPYTPRWWP